MGNPNIHTNNWLIIPNICESTAWEFNNSTYNTTNHCWNIRNTIKKRFNPSHPTLCRIYNDTNISLAKFNPYNISKCNIRFLDVRKFKWNITTRNTNRRINICLQSRIRGI